MKKGQYYPTSCGHRNLCSQKPFMKLKVDQIHNLLKIHKLTKIIQQCNMKIAHKTKQYFYIKFRDYRRQKEINSI